MTVISAPEWEQAFIMTLLRDHGSELSVARRMLVSLAGLQRDGVSEDSRIRSAANALLAYHKIKTELDT